MALLYFQWVKPGYKIENNLKENTASVLVDVVSIERVFSNVWLAFILLVPVTKDEMWRVATKRDSWLDWDETT